MIYYLDKAEWPTIPAPHDCVINKISLSDDFLILDFEQGIPIHDSIRNLCPNARSLTIKIHLIDTFDIYRMKTRKFPKFRRSYIEFDFDKLIRLVERKRVEYLYHHVSYQSLIVNLYCHENIILNLSTDSLEYIWKM